MDSIKANISEQIQDLLKRININVSHVLSEVIDDSPLTAHQMYIMKVIRKNSRINLTSLCKDMLLSKSSMSLTIDKLVENGYVFRQECSHDRRSINIFLTEKGEKALDDTTDRVREKLNLMTADFTVDELEEIKSCFQKLYESTEKIIKDNKV